MRAVGSCARRELRMTVEQEGDVAGLNDGGHGFGAVGQGALVRRRETKKQGGDVACLQRPTDVTHERRGVAELRRDEIQSLGLTLGGHSSALYQPLSIVIPEAER